MYKFGWLTITLSCTALSVIEPAAVADDLAVNPQPWIARATADLNGDGRTDIIWQETLTGLLYTWLMNGPEIIDAGLLNAVGPSWSLQATADFNDDSKDDMLWRHAQTGELVVWLMDGLQVVATLSIGNVVDKEWGIVAARDSDGDGDADLYWIHADTNTALLWRLNGPFPISASVLGQVSDPSWGLVSAGDLDHDGNSDLVWYNDTYASGYAWFINGPQIIGTMQLGSMPSTQWVLTQAADFDGNGDDDVVWQNRTTGEVVIERLFDEHVINGAASAGTLQNPNATLVCAADFNGDGRADMLWQDPDTLESALWIIDDQLHGTVHPLPDCVPCGVPPATRYILVEAEEYEEIFDGGNQIDTDLIGYIEQYDIQKAFVFSGGTIDPERDGYVNLDEFKELLELVMPVEYDGFAAIDLEEPYFDHLILGPGNPLYETTVEQMLLAIQLGQSLRPKAKWSFYGVPRLRRWFHEPQHIEIAAAPTVLFEHMDWFGPSVYDVYPNHLHDIFRENHVEHISDLVGLCRDIAQGRPVIPYVWHRRHPGGNNLDPPAFHVINPVEFMSDQVDLVMQLGADGVIWFNSDQYYYYEVAEHEPPYPKNHHLHALQVYLSWHFANEIPPQSNPEDHFKLLKSIFLPMIGDAVHPFKN